MARTTRNKKGKKNRGSTIKLVVKSNELVEARYMFDVWETRFFHSLIASIHKDDEDDKIYRLWFKDIKKNFQLKSNQSYDFLREAAISMAGKSVYIGWQKDKFQRGRMHRIIRFVDYLEKGQTGEGIGQQEYVDVSIDKDIRPYLLDIKKKFNPEIDRYTSYDLRNIIRLKPYATRLYELLKQMEYKGFRTIVIEDLKNMFEIVNEYPRFSNFYQKVILSSVEAINKYTDLTIPLEQITKIKKGRRVYALRFRILGKSEEEVMTLRGEAPQISLFKDVEEAQVVEEKDEVQTLYEAFEEVVVKSFGVTGSTFKKMLATGKYKAADIEQAIAVTRRAKYRQEIKKTVSGFFRTALKEGFTDAEEETKKRKQAKAAELRDLEAKLLAVKDELSNKINERIKQITNENEVVTQRAIAAIKENTMTEALVRIREKDLGRELEIEDYRKDGRLRGLVISNIISQEEARFADLLTTYNPQIESLTKAIRKLKAK